MRGYDPNKADFTKSLRPFLLSSAMNKWIPGISEGQAVDAFIEAVHRSFNTPLDSDPIGNVEFRKSGTFTQPGSATDGLNYYDLELGAKFVYPVLTPLRNEIPRVSGKGGIQANWRAVTGINTSGLRIGVSVGHRNAYQAISYADYIAVYKGIGLETSVDFEAQYAGMGFDDIRAIAARVGLEATMLGEEYQILGGNTSMALGTTPTPSLSTSTSGGSLAAQTWSVICVALAFDGYLNGSVSGGIQQAITRTNADGSSDTFGGGAALKSSNATQATTGTTSTISASVAGVQGAAGYAWFWGTAGSEVLGAITTINSVLITAAATGTQTAASLSGNGGTDYSTNALAFDGLLTQALKSGQNAYVAAQPTGTAGAGTPLTSDGAGGIVEIDTLLKNRWDLYRLSPDTMWVNSQEATDISQKIMTTSSSNPGAQRFVFAVDQGNIKGGVMARSYLNKFSMAGPKDVEIRVHPNMPPGPILFTSKTLPYPLSNVGNVMQIRTRQDYYQIQWPLVTRQWQYGVYADEVLQHYFPPSMGVIYNIGAPAQI
jgi:hypothetical protein